MNSWTDFVAEVTALAEELGYKTIVGAGFLQIIYDGGLYCLLTRGCGQSMRDTVLSGLRKKVKALKKSKEPKTNFLDVYIDEQ